MTRIIGIMSGKGGVGKTTTVANLSIALHKFGKRVTIIDCNLSTPHLSYYLGIKNYNYTINDVLLGKVDINNAIYNHNGVKYIPASFQLENLLNLDLKKLKSYLSQLPSKKTDFILLDSAPGLGKEALNVANACDEIIFITNPYVPMVSDILRSKEVIKGFGEKKMSIIVNMTMNRKHEIMSKNIEKLTGIPVMMEIPFDKNVNYSIAMGLPVIEYRPNSLASIGFKKLASIMSEKDYDVPLKFKIHNLFSKARNSIFPGDIEIPEKVEELKEEFLFQ